MTYGTVSADAIKSSNGSTMSPASSMGFKNRIINGAMVIDQRNAGASVTATTDGQYFLDRWKSQLSQSSKFTVQQNAGSITPPTGFTKYLGVTSSSAFTPASTDYMWLSQAIEGVNVADLGWGTANAKTITVSFQVYSSLTGSFGGCVGNQSANRTYPFSFTVGSANTWTSISITIAGDTTGTWTTDSSQGINLYFNLGTGTNRQGTANTWSSSDYRGGPTGSVNILGTSGATFYITGVQLEVGSTATSFDYRPYGTELMLCQRYCYTLGGAFNGSPSWNQYCTGALTTSTQFSGTMQIPVTMRASPSFSYSASSLSNFWVVSASAATNPTAIALNQASPTAFNITATVSGHTAGQAGVFYQNSGLATQLQLTAEL